MKKKKFYNSRIYMFVILIIFAHLLIYVALLFFTNLGGEMNWLYWAGLICRLLFGMLFLYITVYSFKQLIKPTLLITVTETGVIVEKDKRNVEIGWGDIESYMICGRPSQSGSFLYFYIFLKDGIASSTIPKELKVEYHFMKNKKILKKAFDKNKIKELPPDYEAVKHIK
ncbi:hypothetical protein [Robertmurraya korlensis]|uniref:hypothetical protein n=1 Tax=Robertmurraya korlensis TaxID=519977 RepID=UPI0008253616|nr:hypothetical protein [Robertmurraya korlensis]